MDLPFKLPSRYTHSGKKFEGGQGSVYVCKDTYLERQVAIKVIEDSSGTAHILKELAAIQKIKSRHVVQIYDIVRSENGDALGIVQEFVPGPHISSHFKAAMGLDEFIKILYQVACGISDIHQSGIVHRDIKPGNMKLDAEGVLKLLDFGLSVESKKAPITNAARGTAYFLAPEMYGTLPIKYTSAVDTYAFGVTARTIAECGAILSAFRQTPPFGCALPSFGTCKLGIPPDVAGVLDATLGEDPQTRPEMTVVRDALERRLLYGKHRAVVTSGGQMHELSDPGKSIILKAGSDQITIKYDGLQFTVEGLAGDVFLNNTRTHVSSILPDSCVITLGGQALKWGRTFAPFNVSHPGVVL
jgi:serine/threonine protein kinase